MPCFREYVFGLSQGRTANPIHLIPSVVSAYKPPSGTRPGTGRQSSSSTRTETPATLVYATAALGVVHDLKTNKQAFFGRHTDEISCITVSSDGLLAATGQVGKLPVVHVWYTSPTHEKVPSSSTKKADFDVEMFVSKQELTGLLLTVGHGVLSRGVCAVGFTYDAAYLAAIGCDDHHTMGVWSIPQGELVIRIGCQNGLPPEIRDLQWSPNQVYTEFVGADHMGLCDLLLTSGRAIELNNNRLKLILAYYNKKQ